MKRKAAAILLTAAMTASVLSGCGGNSSTGTADQAGTETPAASDDGAGDVTEAPEDLQRQTARRLIPAPMRQM